MYKKVLLTSTLDKLEGYLVEELLKKNDIEFITESYSFFEKKRKLIGYNIFVDNEDLEEGMKSISIIQKEKDIKENNIEETKLFTQKQLIFGFIVSGLFVVLIIIMLIMNFK